MNIDPKLIKVFQDTINWINTDQQLSEACQYSIENTILYQAENYPELPEHSARKTTIAVSGSKSFQAALRLRQKFPEARIAVHNFASALAPGGAVQVGAKTQEEGLCRCSTLYPCLKSYTLHQDFYLYNRNRRDLRYTDACIYSPDVLIIKNDKPIPERLPEQEFCKVDILTCAAPHLFKKSDNLVKRNAFHLTDREQAELHRKRARHMFTIAAAHHDEILILGAFGCGAFNNNPYIVAEAYREVLREPEFKNRFLYIEFAVFPKDSENFKAFSSIFST